MFISEPHGVTDGVLNIDMDMNEEEIWLGNKLFIYLQLNGVFSACSYCFFRYLTAQIRLVFFN